MSVGYIRIYYDNQTGNKIAEVSIDGGFIPQSIGRDIESFTVLSERNRETFDVLELPYGAYAQEFREARLIGVNIETKKPIFEYPNPENPSEPIIPPKPLSEEIAEVKARTEDIELALAEIFLGGM